MPQKKEEKILQNETEKCEASQEAKHGRWSPGGFTAENMCKVCNAPHTFYLCAAVNICIWQQTTFT